jgi:hypothetical protein
MSKSVGQLAIEKVGSFSTLEIMVSCSVVNGGSDGPAGEEKSGINMLKDRSSAYFGVDLVILSGTVRLFE